MLAACCRGGASDHRAASDPPGRPGPSWRSAVSAFPGRPKLAPEAGPAPAFRGPPRKARCPREVPHCLPPRGHSERRRMMRQRRSGASGGLSRRHALPARTSTPWSDSIRRHFGPLRWFQGAQQLSLTIDDGNCAASSARRRQTTMMDGSAAKRAPMPAPHFSQAVDLTRLTGPKSLSRNRASSRSRRCSSVIRCSRIQLMKTDKRARGDQRGNERTWSNARRCAISAESTGTAPILSRAKAVSRDRHVADAGATAVAAR